jgi:hypothetical protein
MQGLQNQNQNPNGGFDQQKFVNQLLPGLQRPKFGAQLSLEQKREFVERGFIIVRNVIPKVCFYSLRLLHFSHSYFFFLPTLCFTYFIDSTVSVSQCRRY